MSRAKVRCILIESMRSFFFNFSFGLDNVIFILLAAIVSNCPQGLVESTICENMHDFCVHHCQTLMSCAVSANSIAMSGIYLILRSKVFLRL